MPISGIFARAIVHAMSYPRPARHVRIRLRGLKPAADRRAALLDWPAARCATGGHAGVGARRDGRLRERLEDLFEELRATFGPADVALAVFAHSETPYLRLKFLGPGSAGEPGICA